MAITDFYTQAIIIISIAAVALVAFWKSCDDQVDKLEDPDFEDRNLQNASRIWSTNLKTSVKDFFSFVQKNIAESESDDKYSELFTDDEKSTLLIERLDRLDKSYKSFLDFRNLLPNRIHEIEETKKWVIRTFLMCFGIAIWGAIGLLVDLNSALDVYKALFWAFLVFEIVVIVIFITIAAKHYQRSDHIKLIMRQERAKYSRVSIKVTNKNV